MKLLLNKKNLTILYEAILRKSLKFVDHLHCDLLMKVAVYYDVEETLNSFDKKVSSVDGVLTILSNVEARNSYESNFDRENLFDEVMNLKIKLVSTLIAMRPFNIRGRGMKFKTISNEFEKAERQHRNETKSTPHHKEKTKGFGVRQYRNTLKD